MTEMDQVPTQSPVLYMDIHVMSGPLPLSVIVNS